MMWGDLVELLQCDPRERPGGPQCSHAPRSHGNVGVGSHRAGGKGTALRRNRPLAVGPPDPGRGRCRRRLSDGMTARARSRTLPRGSAPAADSRPSEVLAVKPSHEARYRHVRPSLPCLTSNSAPIPRPMSRRVSPRSCPIPGPARGLLLLRSCEISTTRGTSSSSRSGNR